MENTVFTNGRTLRTGYTTGSCATAAAKAAAIMLVNRETIDAVKISTPSGADLDIEVLDIAISEDEVTCAVIKDAGDDPDVTNGMRVYATVRKCPSGVQIEGGIGIGRVTRKGLPRSIGCAAINPGPMAQIKANLAEIIDMNKLDHGFAVLIWAPDGVLLAEKTFNPRLGIIGGISILGTSGIVHPMSESALIETVRLELRMRHAVNSRDVLITPGNYGRDFATCELGLDIDAGVKCSNYFGEALDYAAHLKFKRILLVGHAGKLTKLAAGVMNTHSRVADCRMETLTAHAAMHGINSGQALQLMNCATTEASLELLDAWGIREAVYGSILTKAVDNINHRTGGICSVDVIIFTVEAGIVAQTKNSMNLVNELCKGNDVLT